MFQGAFLAILILFTITGRCFGDWYTDPSSGSKGWYAYQTYEDNETLEDQEEETEEALPAPQKWPTLEEAMLLGANKLGELIDRATDVAIGNPTEENVARWVGYMDVARRKSYAFANVAAWVKQKNPRFNTVTQSPYNFSGRVATAKARLAAVKSYIKDKTDEIAVLLFLAKGVPLSAPAKKIMKDFCKARGIEFRAYDLSFENARTLADSIGVSAIPQAWVISRIGNPPFPILTGTTSKDQIEMNLYRGLRIVYGDAVPENYAEPLPVTASREIVR